jgi:hypothetical protein
MKMLKDILAAVVIVALAGVVIHDHGPFQRPPAGPPAPAPAPTPAPAPVPVPGPGVSGQALGRAYAPLLLASYGEAWLAAARTLEEGKPVAAAQQTLQDTWKAARVQAFTEHVVPSFALVLPEGAEPASPEKRAEVVKLWRDFAHGLTVTP